MVLTCTKHQVGRREEKKAQSSPRPLIGATHNLQPPSSQHLVPSVGLFHQDPVRPHVHRHSGKENCRSGRKSPPKPLVLVVIGVVRDPSGLQVGIQEVESEGQNYHGNREIRGGFPIGDLAMEVEQEQAGLVKLMEEEVGDESEGFRIRAMDSQGEEEEGEPERGTLHEEPGQRRRHCWAPPGLVVLVVRSREEATGEGGGCPDEENGKEVVPKHVLI
ncbi:hypothetical protein PanWU01x14_324650 [Parasponia andersonii]|uniref:Uncharacterized protein n=1 Tax=Parasponia andersonii TaxID=3476 RepID=A0A2P5AK40_PARAD|nr:hypothetical protein PanWU01x14_324650 [Parasponia andersonii]